jgi:hypothetical protein
VSCVKGVRDLQDGFWIGWLDLLTPYSHNSGLQAIQRFRCSTHFTVRRCTRTRILSLHWSYPGNGFITLPLLLQITHGVFFAQPDFFLAIILPTANSIQFQAHNAAGWRPETRHFTSRLLCWITLYNHFARTPRKTPSSFVPYCFRRVYRTIA